jgi:hypothetical protein
MVFSLSTIPLTPKATILRVVKLQAMEESSDLYIPTNISIIYFHTGSFPKVVLYFL